MNYLTRFLFKRVHQLLSAKRMLKEGKMLEIIFRPLLFSTRKRYYNEFKDGFPNGTEVIMTESDWINEKDFIHWLQHF